jgi:ABC-type transport system involved in multi-copper enzyme maturation permease subunit
MPPGRAWAVIARGGIRGMLARRGFLGLLLLAWIPFLVRAVQVYMAANVPQADFLAPTAETFRDFIGQQEVFVFFIAVSAGAGLVANDRRANALQIYLSRPLHRWEYIAGKLAILLVFVLLVTWLPGMMLLLAQVMFAGNFAFLKANVYLFPAITLVSVLQAAAVSFMMLALSSMSTSSRYAGILYASVMFLSQAIYGIIHAVTASSSMAWISFSANQAQVGAAIFRLSPRYDMPWLVSLAVILALIGLSALVLDRRVRGLDVVT